MKNGTTSTQTTDALRNIFAMWSLPQQLHADDRPQFVSREFQQFMTSNGICHTTSAIYHPSSNGQAERFVAIFKRALKLMKSEPGSLEAKIARFLLTYSTFVNSSTGEIRSVLMTGRRSRTRLDLTKPAQD
jgi:transposase InsO family protein